VVLSLGPLHLCSDKDGNDETTFKMFEILLPLVKIKFGMGVLRLGTPHLCSDVGRNEETTF